MVGTTPDEAFVFGRHIAEKLNRAKGPTVLLVPMRGWTAYDIAGPDSDWVGPVLDQGHSGLQTPDKPAWSLRAKRFLEGLNTKIDLTKPNLAVMRST